MRGEGKEIIKALEYIAGIFKNPTKLEILIILNQAKKPLSFSELRSYMNSQISSAHLSYHFRALEKEKIIRKEIRVDKSSGKLRFSFYILTSKGKKLAEILEKIARLVEEKKTET